jgi:glycine cleavage system protein P-like pyridoxal-binding family
MDEYFTLDIAQALVDAGFKAPFIQPNTIRHRTIIAPCA